MIIVVLTFGQAQSYMLLLHLTVTLVGWPHDVKIPMCLPLSPARKELELQY